jgi:long-chain fatty acid transport protein
MLGFWLLRSVAYTANDKLSLGASLNVMYGILENKVAINNLVGADGQLKLEDERWGVGVNLGLLYELDPRTRLGLTYNSQVNLDFAAQAEFSGLAPGLQALLAARGLLGANVNLGIKVPQGVMGSVFHQLNDRWALLGSAGWQQWSKFGQSQVSVDSSNPTSLTVDLGYKDTWHVAGGAQYRLSDPWLLNFGVAYDSKFQSGSTVPVALPANSAWRFGVGAQQQSGRSFSWGLAAEYLYGGTLDVDQQSATPVVLGGRGNVVGSFKNVGMYFLAANFNWRF